MAEAVGRPVYELEQEMPLHEVIEWRAFFNIRHEAEKKAAEKARQDSERKRPHRGGRR